MKKVVIFTGAGVSAESGIQTFRDPINGLWAKFKPEQLATPQAFQNDPALVWGRILWRRQQVKKAQPNAAHLAISELQKYFDVTIITQNVDDLHERAGSTNILHLHGDIMSSRCFDCKEPHHFISTEIEPEEGRRVEPPHCHYCNGKIRPNVVWFNEALPSKEWDLALKKSMEADIFITIGTSGLVYPAAHLPEFAKEKGAYLIQVNPNSTPLDALHDENHYGAAGEIIPQLLAKLV